MQRLLALGLLASSCQAGGPSPFALPPPATGATGAAGGSSSGSSTGMEGSSGDGTSDGASGSGAILLDVGSDKDLGPGTPPGCQGKLDLLFVISRYGGMETFQAQLLDAFPKFIDTIEAKFSDFDVHLMVVDGDASWGLSTCDALCPGPCSVPGYPCDHTPDLCDLTLGAGTSFPAGEGAANKACQLDGGRYMTGQQPDLAGAFACAGQVGVSGRAWIGEALASAVQPGINAGGGCNEGFLRDDALLVVTLISNTYDYGPKPGGSSGSPEIWAAAILDAKHGDPESIVMLSILRAFAACEVEDRTCQMVKMFPHHLLFDRDMPDYGPAFDQATELVEDACAGFTPPG